MHVDCLTYKRLIYKCLLLYQFLFCPHRLLLDICEKEFTLFSLIKNWKISTNWIDSCFFVLQAFFMIRSKIEVDISFFLTKLSQLMYTACSQVFHRLPVRIIRADVVRIVEVLLSWQDWLYHLLIVIVTTLILRDYLVIRRRLLKACLYNISLKIRLRD